MNNFSTWYEVNPDSGAGTLPLSLLLELPDFRSLETEAFRHSTWNYFTDVIWNQEIDPYGPGYKSLLELNEELYGKEQEQEIAWEHDDYYLTREPIDITEEGEGIFGSDAYYSHQGDPVEGRAFFGLEEEELLLVANTTTVRSHPVSHPAECCCNLCDVETFIDQNGLLVHDGAVYGTDEQGELYELESIAPFRPSEY